MEAHDKPYLILEMDDHDSSVGYETRIEAAVRAFKNHDRLQEARILKDGVRRIIPKPDFSGVNPQHAQSIAGKTIVLPNWDPITCRFLAATIRGEGYETHLMEETPETIRQSIKTNTGQCIPLNAIAQGFAQTMKNKELDPANTVLWMSRSEIACNIKMYPFHIKTILERWEKKYKEATVYKGNLALSDISIQAAGNAYFSYMFGGLLRSVGCKIRPYEINHGETDQKLAKAIAILEKAFEENSSKEAALKEALIPFSDIRTKREYQRPKVGIFGDFYVRDNDVMNQDLIAFIENLGGEVITTPYYRFAKMIAGPYFRKWFKEGKYLDLISNKALLTAMNLMEKKYVKYFTPLLGEETETFDDPYEKILEEYCLLPEHTGESMDNILKIHYTLKAHPDLTLFVQTSPALCCPALITEAMAGSVERKTGIPVVSVTYDGSGGENNRILIPFLGFKRQKEYPQSLRKSV